MGRFLRHGVVTVYSIVINIIVTLISYRVWGFFSILRYINVHITLHYITLIFDININVNIYTNLISVVIIKL